MQIRVQAAINNTKVNKPIFLMNVAVFSNFCAQIEQEKIKSAQLAYEAQLSDPELVFRSIGFTIFLSVWLIRQVDPKKTHPSPPAEYVHASAYHRIANVQDSLPLSQDVPMAFRVLPEYIIEDIVTYLHFATQ